jgi:Lytic transglycolase
MADQELGKGQLAPVARPVSSFLSFQSANPAAPMRPEMLGNPSQINMIQRGSNMNVQGVNSAAELAAALKPLTQLADAGLELYAGHEYKKGRNEVLRASALVNRQTIQAGDEYAADNRALARENPVAAMMMDRVNPFRQAGRQNQASQLVAQEMPRAMRQAWRDNADRLSKLDEASPELDQVRAGVVTQMAQKFGLDEFSPGFQDYALPIINREWEQFQTRHLAARNGYLKDTQHVLLGNQLYSELIGWDSNVKTQGQLLENLGGLVEANAKQMGLPEDVAEMKTKAIVGLIQRLQMIANDPAQPLAGQARKMLGIVSQIPMGMAGPDGTQLTAGEVNGMDILEGMDKLTQIQRRQRDNAQGDLGLSFEQTYGQQFAGLTPGSTTAQALIQQAMNDPNFQGLPFTKKQELLVNMGSMNEKFTGLQVPKAGVEDWFQQQEDRFGSDWNERAARNQFNSLEAGIPVGATDERKRARDRFEELVRRRRSESESNYNTSLINRNITETTKAQLSQRYPDITEAAMQGVTNIDGLMAYGDSARKAATQKMTSALNQQIYADLGAATAANKGKLSVDQQQQVIDGAIKKVTGDKERMQQLMPPIKSLGGPPKGPDGKPVPPPPGKKPAQVQTFTPGTLNSVPVERIKQWEAVPLLNANDTQSLLLDAMNGKSLPAPFRRAAIRAGTTPEQLLLQQADFYPGAAFTPTPAQRKAILRQGNRAEGLRQSVAGGAPVFGPLSAATNVIGNILMGVQPAYARSFNPARDNPYTGQPYSRGGGQWESGPAVAASHRDSGSGYTIPGARDANGRPPIFSRGGANAFAAMVRDSGGAVKPGDIASSQRSAGKNAAVGGVNGSEHLGGNAMDIHGASEAWIRKNGAKYGWYVHDYAGSHGGHFEFRGGGNATPQVATRRGEGMTGLATFYNGSGGSDGVAGGPTANGETYNPNAMTAAVQWSLRGKYLNKWVQVEDMDSGKAVRVWVNDVGQMGGTEKSVSKADPRVIDLSPAAFKKLFGSTSRGVGRIRIVPR